MEKKVVLVDPDEVFRSFLRSTIEATGEFQIIGTTGDGLEGLELVRKLRPDILLMEAVLPTLDGLSVLRRINEEMGSDRPQTILLSVFSRPHVVAAAKELDAFYFLAKPCTNRSLLEWMHRACSQVTCPITNAALEEMVTHILHDIGVPPHVVGHHYLRSAILLCVKDGRPIRGLTVGLYSEVAKQFATSGANVERSIRHAIESAWDRGDLDTLQNYFGYTISRSKGRPTNSEFIAMVVDHLQLQLKNRWA